MNKNKWFLRGGRGSGRTFRLLCEVYENKIAEQKKEYSDNLSLKDEELMCLETDFNTYKSGAKEIIRKCIEHLDRTNYFHYEIITEAERFLKE